MLKTIKRKVKETLGFSLAETFLTVLILLMVSTIVASGIPIAADVYKRAVETANAQLLLSTTLTTLRDELGTAGILSAEETVIEYMVDGGMLRIIADEEGIKKQTGEGDRAHSVLLVSNAAANKNLHAAYESVSYSGGVLTFSNIQALNERGAALASVGEYKIKILTSNS